MNDAQNDSMNVCETAEKPVAPVAKAVDERPAAVRTAELFDAMKPHRKAMLKILDLCREARDVEVVDQYVRDFQTVDVSVFDAAALCRLLEKAGALDRDGAQGDVEPEIVEIDGVRYYEVSKERVFKFVTTQTGLDVLEADKPLERFEGLLARDAGYEHIYLTLLLMCTEEGGATAAAMGDAVDDDPALQSPRRYALYYFNNLEHVDLIEWTGEVWLATDLGRSVVPMLEARVAEALNA